MAVKPENTFRAGVHKHLPRNLYRVKMANLFAAGIPDDYYSGRKADLWVEYKYIPKITPALAKLPNLSALQIDWLNNRRAEGRNVAVIVGCPNGGVIYRDGEWEVPLSTEAFERRVVPRTELANWIVSQTGGPP